MLKPTERPRRTLYSVISKVVDAGTSEALPAIHIKEITSRSRGTGERLCQTGGMMPFIRGRYYMNPIYGAAVEAAREAEGALESAEQSGRGGKSATTTSAANSRGSESEAQGPIHRIEIEATEVVPSHSGHAQRGFVARVHRASVTSGAPGKSSSDQEFVESPASYAPQSRGGATQSGRVQSQQPEIHVFADPQDLADFLQGEFEKDAGR